MLSRPPCAECGALTDRRILAEADWYPGRHDLPAACPACVQQRLLRTLLDEGDPALHRAIQAVWPLDPEAAFSILPTPLRLHADPRFTGRGVTVALVDSGFYPHPDLVLPHNRIRVWAQLGRAEGPVRWFGRDDEPTWPGWSDAADSQWHGTMTSVTALGNGHLSRGLYRGLAPDAELALIAVRDDGGRITNASIVRALGWLLEQRDRLGLRVVNLSVAGEAVEPLAGNPVDVAVEALVAAGVVVTAAAGNDGARRLLPPATAPRAITVGGLDDRNLLSHEERMLWHSNYGASSGGAGKPELVAPSIWVAAPVLPGSGTAAEAERLFAAGGRRDPASAERIRELKLITPHYQHVDGTSFAAPVVASAVAALLEANPDLTPSLIRDVLLGTAQPVSGAPSERQGAGVIDAGRAVAAALREMHGAGARDFRSPSLDPDGVRFAIHDHAAVRVRVFGSWNRWRGPGLDAHEEERGFWLSAPLALPHGEYSYKFLLDEGRWLDDPENPEKAPDGQGALNSVLRVG
jgi:serine protease AprX